MLDSFAASPYIPSHRLHREQQQAFPPADDLGDDSSKNLEPKFIRGPANAQVQEGKLVRFEARATGRPYPEVSLPYPTLASLLYLCVAKFSP